jgi:Bacterial regulatory proteins, luxR family
MATSMRNDMRLLPLPAEDIVAAIEHTTLNLAHAGLACECWSDTKEAGFHTPSNVIAPRAQPGEASRDLMPYIGSVLAGRIARDVRSRAHRPSRCSAGVLSGREGEILGLLGNGLSTKRIALALGIAPETEEDFFEAGGTNPGRSSFSSHGPLFDATGQRATPPFSGSL